MQKFALGAGSAKRDQRQTWTTERDAQSFRGRLEAAAGRGGGRCNLPQHALVPSSPLPFRLLTLQGLSPKLQLVFKEAGIRVRPGLSDRA
jgi:hypothetical protein